MTALARLFGLLRPHRVRLAAAIVCMVVYSITSTIWLVLIQPFMGVLFRGQQAAPTMSATPMPGLVGLQTRLMGWLGAVPPLQAFGRLCIVILVLFLLDLGTLAAQRLRTLKAVGIRLVVFAIGMPVVFGTLGTVGGTVAGLSVGGAAVLGAMAASASYIAAPAAVRVGLPDADVGLSLGAALGMTFPFNLAIGIPLFHEIAQKIG